MPPPQSPFRVASVQMESQPADKSANLRTIERFVEQAVSQGARLVVFPECCVTGYWFMRHLNADQLAELAEPVPAGPSTQRVIELARRYNITVD